MHGWLVANLFGGEFFSLQEGVNGLCLPPALLIALGNINQEVRSAFKRELAWVDAPSFLDSASTVAKLHGHRHTMNADIGRAERCVHMIAVLAQSVRGGTCLIEKLLRRLPVMLACDSNGTGIHQSAIDGDVVRLR